MKPAGLYLLVPAGLALLAAAAEPDAPKISSHLKEAIRASLPAFAPKPDQPSPETPAALDPDVLILSKMVVKEKRPPGHDPDVWLADREVQQKAMAAYKDSMTPLEWALNSWFIPLFTPPASVRARMAYDSAKVAAELDRLAWTIKAVESVDPPDAAKLKKELLHDPDLR